MSWPWRRCDEPTVEDRVASKVDEALAQHDALVIELRERLTRGQEAVRDGDTR